MFCQVRCQDVIHHIALVLFPDAFNFVDQQDERASRSNSLSGEARKKVSVSMNMLCSAYASASRIAAALRRCRYAAGPVQLAKVAASSVIRSTGQPLNCAGSSV